MVEHVFLIADLINLGLAAVALDGFSVGAEVVPASLAYQLVALPFRVLDEFPYVGGHGSGGT